MKNDKKKNKLPNLNYYLNFILYTYYDPLIKLISTSNQINQT